MFGEDRYLRELLEETRENGRVLRKILHQLQTANRIEGFEIVQQETSTMLPIAPGFSPVFTATPVPSTSVPSTPPTWTSSDTTNAPITVDPTGLIATAAIPASATVGATGTFNISYTNADGTVATGSFSWTIVAAPSPDITSFTIAQTT
jgi:hypothetical protein